MRSVALGFWIGTGSSAEDEPEAGLLAPGRAHALPRARPLRVAGDRPALRRHGRRAQRRHRQGDDVGLLAGARRAPGARRSTSWPTWSGGRASTPRSWRQEREIVLEEIAMYEDDPQDKVFDVLGEAVFGDHPLGRRDHRPRRRRGRDARAAARRLPRRPLRAAQRRRRRRRVGRPRRARRARPARRGGARGRPAAAGAVGAARGDGAAARALPRPRTPSSTTSASAARGSRATTSAASRCACSTTSSAARRRRGCSRRSASSAAWPTPSTRSRRCYAGTGQVGLYLGTRPDNVVTALRGRRPASSSASARTPPARPSSRAPGRTSRAASCSLESTTARMNRLGSSVLADLPLLTSTRSSSASTP